jgi:glycosyltransferase involved in cell wall biosynthesis
MLDQYRLPAKSECSDHTSVALRVCLDARLTSGLSGGVEQVIIGLAAGLSQLTEGNEEYYFLTYKGTASWLRPYIGGPCRLLLCNRQPASKLKAGIRSIFPQVRRAAALLRSLPFWPVRIPVSDGTIERAGIDVMHFTTQDAFLTTIPTLYQPHDLQHLHFPQYFSKHQWRDREHKYRTFCRQARLVCVMTHWGKQDLLNQYHFDSNKVAVIPWAPTLSTYPQPGPADIDKTRRAYALPEAFVYYPAQTWPHKNHLALFDALAILRDHHGLVVPLVCSGRLNEFFPTIKRHMHKLGLASQVRFLGFVSPLEVQCLYRLCRAVVFPSEFEGWGLPVTEAFFAGVPVACSNVTSLPEVAGDAALLFNPDDPTEIAEAIRQLWTDDDLCRNLIERGRRRVSGLSWEKTARIFRAHYRRIAGRPLTEEDRALIAKSMSHTTMMPTYSASEGY